MPIRGYLAYNDQGQLVQIDPNADPDNIQPEDVEPIDVADLNLSGQLTGESGRTVYDDSTETVGDGQTSADHESVSTGDVATEKIGSGQIHYAGDYDGSDPDTRLDNAIAAATNNDRIYLEDDSYDASRTISKELEIVGISPATFRGPNLTSRWTLSARCSVKGAEIESGIEIIAQGVGTFFEDVSGNGEITVQADRIRVLDSDQVSVTFESGNSGGLVDSCTGVVVTDNDGGNTIGDIA